MVLIKIMQCNVHIVSLTYVLKHKELCQNQSTYLDI